MEKIKKKKNNLLKVIVASSIGSLIEWYDFYIFGSLASIIALHFYPGLETGTAYMLVLATFAAGFVVRPFGALFFGWIGDLIGRRYAFLMTIIMMGSATFLIGLVPDFAEWGYGAPLCILILRMTQGLALGGEFGGGVTYVAEHSPPKHRGFFTGFIQTTATLGLFLSIGVILISRRAMSPEDFYDWGWRVPFWFSFVLVCISVFIRLKMKESPLFIRLKKEGRISTNPLKETFTVQENLKLVLLALFCATMGQGVLWYTGQFYSQVFIQKVMFIDYEQSLNILATALIFTIPFFVVFGAFSDKVGRKNVMMAGMFLAIISYRPIYKAMYQLSDLNAKIELTDKTTYLEKAVLSGTDSVHFTTRVRYFSDGTVCTEVLGANSLPAAGKTGVVPTEKAILLSQKDRGALIFLIFLQVVFVAMVYGPIAAFLVELFPTRIRYTSLALPYNVGNGIFGGLTPLIALKIMEDSRLANPAGQFYLEGLWYTVIIASICLFCCLIFIKNPPNQIPES